MFNSTWYQSSPLLVTCVLNFVPTFLGIVPKKKKEKVNNTVLQSKNGAVLQYIATVS